MTPEELQELTHHTVFEESQPFRETFLALLDRGRDEEAVRAFGGLLQSLVFESLRPPVPGAEPAPLPAFRAAVADLRYLIAVFASIGRGLYEDGGLSAHQVEVSQMAIRAVERMLPILQELQGGMEPVV